MNCLKNHPKIHLESSKQAFFFRLFKGEHDILTFKCPRNRPARCIIEAFCPLSQVMLTVLDKPGSQDVNERLTCAPPWTKASARRPLVKGKAPVLRAQSCAVQHHMGNTCSPGRLSALAGNPQGRKEPAGASWCALQRHQPWYTGEWLLLLLLNAQLPSDRMLTASDWWCPFPVEFFLASWMWLW